MHIDIDGTTPKHIVFIELFRFFTSNEIILYDIDCALKINPAACDMMRDWNKLHIAHSTEKLNYWSVGGLFDEILHYADYAKNLLKSRVRKILSDIWH